MDHATCPYQYADDQLGQKRPIIKPRPPPQKKAHPQFKSEDACRKWNKYYYLSGN